MRTFRLDLQYDGTSFLGWQRQKEGRSVQGQLEKALKKMTKEDVDVLASGRTDAGVHARQQVVSFNLNHPSVPVEAFKDGLNAILPSDIQVHRSAEVDSSFHARKNATRKTYRYFFQVGEDPLVFLRNYTWVLKGPLHLNRMHEAAQQLVGTHDFKAFMGPRTSVKTTEREIYEASFFSEHLNLLVFQISASGFLRHMVRIIVGTLVEIGSGKREAKEMAEILKQRNRSLAGPTAPASGLFLWTVFYD